MNFRKQDMYSAKMGGKQLLQFFLFASMVVQSKSQLNCTSDLRLPAHSDLSVTCGTSSLDLAILICPAVYSGFNETLLFLNNAMTDSTCWGTLDTSVDPPVIRFSFPLNMTNSCGSVFTTTSAAGTGVFADFSNIQTVNVSGMVWSYDPTRGPVSYNTELKYFYSCSYPLEYFINNTRIDVSSSSIAVRDRNGSFISTLKMQLFSDINYTTPLVMPRSGLELRTEVYVQVQASNLTSQYYVLLDRCYASISMVPSNSTFFNLFVSCSKDQNTKMIENGASQHARFSFSAFRFTEQQNQTLSTYYLHCITRLCEISTCSQFLQCPSNRRRRDVEETSAPFPEGLTETTTLTSKAIITRTENGPESMPTAQPHSGNPKSNSAMGLGVAVGVLALICVAVLTAATIFYKRSPHSSSCRMLSG